MSSILKIEIISDTVCPWCYVGKRRIESALLECPEITAEITWRPFQLNPLMPPEGMDYGDYYRRKFGDEDRIAKIRSAMVEAGEEEGLDFKFEKIKRAPNTLASHRLIRWAGAAGVQDAAVETLFRTYFMEGQDIGETDVLIHIAGEAGMDAELVSELYREGRDVELVAEEIRTAQDSGVTGVPFFILNEEMGIPGAQEAGYFKKLFTGLMAS